MRRGALSVLVIVSMLVLSSCGGGDDSDTSKAAPSSEPSSSASPTAEATDAEATEVPRPATTSEAAELAATVLGTNAARTAEEKTVVKAWMRYWTAVAETYDELEPAPGLDSARGKPLTQVLDYLDTLKSKGHRSVGWTRDNVLEVSVEGAVAVVKDCAENFTFEVDADGKPVEDVTPFYDIVGMLEKRDGDWAITAMELNRLDKDCRS
jgi:hypothetical protein